MIILYSDVFSIQYAACMYVLSNQIMFNHDQQQYQKHIKTGYSLFLPLRHGVILWKQMQLAWGYLYTTCSVPMNVKKKEIVQLPLHSAKALDFEPSQFQKSINTYKYLIHSYSHSYFPRLRQVFPSFQVIACPIVGTLRQSESHMTDTSTLRLLAELSWRLHHFQGLQLSVHHP